VKVDRLYRFPVKGLAGEPLESAPLTAGQGMPNDRRFAIVRGDTRFDPAAPTWFGKQRCVMLMRDAELARLACRVDFAAGTIELRAPGAAPCVAALEGSRREPIEAYLNAFLGRRPEGPAHFAEAGELSFTDVPQNCLSLINLESVGELGARTGRDLHPLRFRGNVYLAGGPPWAELAWVGREVAVGDVVLRVLARIPRCAATGVDPESGRRDLNVVRALRDAYGHHDMGVYAEVVRGGRIARGDLVVPPEDARPPSHLAERLGFLRFIVRNAGIWFRRRRSGPDRHGVHDAQE
jgi:uncharacterized protein YcbX